MARFAFLHVGPDTTYAAILVRSIRAHHSSAEIVQCSDQQSPRTEGVDTVFRLGGSPANLMAFRVMCFAAMEIAYPTFFLDTDMICMGPIDPASTLGANDLSVCAREFGRDEIINTRFRGMNLLEYTGMTLGLVYPYIGCATITSRREFWNDCLDNLLRLDPKFHCWYGDQEAIRNIVHSGKYRVSSLPESLYACLPEHETRLPQPKILHFKGAVRKSLMVVRASQLGLIRPVQS